MDTFRPKMWRHIVLYVALMCMCYDVINADQETINYIAENLDVRYNVISNMGTDGTLHDVEIILTNSGTVLIPGGTEPGWELYLCSVRPIEPDILWDGGAELGETGLWVYPVAGCLHKIVPTDSFSGIEPGKSLNIRTVAQYWNVARTDAMPNWYITDAASEPRVIMSTSGESLDFVGDHDTCDKWKRWEEDTYNPYTGEDRFDMRDYADLGSAQAKVLPTPVQESLDADQTVNIRSGDWVVVSGDGLAFEAAYLAAQLDTVVVEPGITPSSHYISMNINPGAPDETERYNLQVDKVTPMIDIEGTDSAGVFYGIQTLLSLAEPHGEVPSGQVVDYPRFHYRGMHMDVGRHFHDKELVKKVLDIMATYKLNKLHFHITDDEGWRLEIPGLPELTEVGAHQCHDPTGDICIAPQLGSGPKSTNEGSGYYTVEDYQEILTYANDRHIQVIPEFDMPGHAHAAVNAMLARYRKYNETNMPVAMEYLLTDLEDPSKYLSGQYFTDNAINPCVDSVYTFVDKVIEETMKMHQDIQPLTTFHFGGDEVPAGAWINSTICHEKELLTTEQIKEWFMANISRVAMEHGLDLSGWEDGYNKNSSETFDRDFFPNANIHTYTWDNTWEWGAGENAYVFANSDYKVIISHSTHLYFDHPYEPDPEERGYYWATRWSDTRKTFGYMPDSVYENIDVDRMGEPLEKEQICEQHGCTELEEDKRPNILGIQGQIWCETVRQAEQLEYMIAPRILALAERAWHKAAWENITDSTERNKQRTADWEGFANTLGYKELARLDNMNVMYAVSPPGARATSERVLEVKAEFPGLPLQYSYDSGLTWSDYKSGVVVNSGNLHVITRSANRARSSRLVMVTVPEEPETGNGIRTSWTILTILTSIISLLNAAYL